SSASATTADADAQLAPHSGDAGTDTGPTAETLTTTADEAATPVADVESDTASQDTEEYRA
ncbi:MAG: SMC-Scp complex subunit ScpB, partial [Rhodanobacter sp.]